MECRSLHLKAVIPINLKEQQRMGKTYPMEPIFIVFP